MGLEDARRRREAAAAAAAAQLTPADYYKMTLDQVGPILNRLVQALVQRVPVAEYRKQFEAERAAQFAAQHKGDRRARRDKFASLHQIEGSEQVGVSIVFNGESALAATVMVALYFDLPMEPYPRLCNVRVEADLGARRWMVREGRDHEQRCGQGWYEWTNPFEDVPFDIHRPSSLARSGGGWREAYVDAIEECVVVFADHYGIPLSELEG